jgi:hypothetical protein
MFLQGSGKLYQDADARGAGPRQPVAQELSPGAFVGWAPDLPQIFPEVVGDGERFVSVRFCHNSMKGKHVHFFKNLDARKSEEPLRCPRAQCLFCRVKNRWGFDIHSDTRLPRIGVTSKRPCGGRPFIHDSYQGRQELRRLTTINVQYAMSGQFGQIRVGRGDYHRRTGNWCQSCNVHARPSFAQLMLTSLEAGPEAEMQPDRR